MSKNFICVRNKKYKMGKLYNQYKHNRKETKYTKQFDESLTYYIIKAPDRYDNEVKRLKKENNLKGQIQKTSNVACEFVVSVNPSFFEKIGEEKTHKFGEDVTEWVAELVCGRDNIIESAIHYEKGAPHIHTVYLPVVETTDKKTGATCRKLSCSELYHKYNSYGDLQDSIAGFMQQKGYDIVRGKHSAELGRQHINPQTYSAIFKDKQDLQEEIEKMPATQEFRKAQAEIYNLKPTGFGKDNYKKQDVDYILDNLMKTVKKRDTEYTNIKGIVKAEEIQKDYEVLEEKYTTKQLEVDSLRDEIKTLEKENDNLKDTIDFQDKLLNKLKQMWELAKGMFTKLIAKLPFEKQEETTENVNEIVNVAQEEYNNIINPPENLDEENHDEEEEDYPEM